MKSVFALGALFLTGVAAEGAVELTAANFDAEVSDSGKAAFVKFLAPWWGHCKKMKPAWDQLGNSFADSKTVIIGDVDCTIEKDLCSKFGVRGYPTIKYFTGATAPEGDKYEGGRDFDSLKAWADENLGPSCGWDNKDLCDADSLAVLEEAGKLSPEDLAAKIKDTTDAMEAAEKHFKDEVQKLQDTYQELTDKKDADIAALSPNLRLWRSIKHDDKAKDEL